MAAPKAKGAVGSITSGTSLVIPSTGVGTVAVGNVLLTQVRSQGTTTDAVSTGWARIGQPHDAGASGGRITGMYMKVADSADVTLANAGGSYTWTVAARASGSMAVWDQAVVLPTVTGFAANNRGTYQDSAGLAPKGRLAPSFAITDPSVVLWYAGNEAVAGVVGAPTIGPTGTTLGTAGQTGTGSASSRTAHGWYYKDEAGPTVPAGFIGWQDVSGEATLAVALKLAATTPPVTPYRGFDTVAEMLSAPGFTVAHRGNSTRYPEESVYAYDKAIERGYGALEFSMGRTSDGVFVGIHDNSINRTSQTSGLPNINAMTWATVQTYQNTLAIEGGPQPYLRLEDFLDRYTDTHVVFIDAKNYGWGAHLTALIDILRLYPANRIVLKSSFNDMTIASAATAEGWASWGYAYESQTGDANWATWNAAWTMLGMEYNASTEAWTAIKAFGKPVLGHIAPNQAAYDQAVGAGRGANGVMTGGSDVVAPVSWWGTLTATGALTITGTATRIITVARTASGTLTLTGTAERTVSIARSAVGTLELSGAASTTGSTTRTADGVLTITGTASVSVSIARTVQGSLALGGIGALTFQIVRTAIAILTLTGVETSPGRAIPDTLTLTEIPVSHTLTEITVSHTLEDA